MTTNLSSTLQTLKNIAQRGFVRIPVFVFGDQNYVTQLRAALSDVPLVSDSEVGENTLPWRAAKPLLGQEIGTVALDVRDALDVERLCAIAGCVRGGELVYLIVGEREAPRESRFWQRFMAFTTQPTCAVICQQQGGQLPSVSIPDASEQTTSPGSGQTDDQRMAIEAIKRVLSGHRRRPALLVADRGRGKSSAMGMAAAEILAAASKHILVTAPTFANVQTLFRHAAAQPHLTKDGKFGLVAKMGGSLRFIAPDALLRERPDCDLLMVDEAAAIPIPLLSQMVKDNSRIVFSSTEHGYEGTGRAFSTRFRALLDHEAKGWKEVRLQMPIRWAEQDPLEAWLFAVFLFDAEPQTVPPLSAVPRIRILTADTLLHDEQTLRQLFSLLVTAHYQTSPNDLIQLFDGEGQTIFAAFEGEVLVGALLLFVEGGFDEALADAVVAGKRRLKGHLLAQSLASHVGLPEVLAAPLARISRIAVLPSCRRKGVGHALIAAAERYVRQAGMPIIGTSFGMTSTLWPFWSSLGYQPARLGVNRDAASGTYSLQLVKALGEAPAWLNQAQQLFCLNLTHQVCEQFADMEPLLLALLLNQAEPQPPCSVSDQQVALFAAQQLGYDLCTGSLWRWFVRWLATQGATAEFDSGCQLLVMRLLQRRSWQAVAAQFGLTGRKAVEDAMRSWIAHQLKVHQKE